MFGDCKVCKEKDKRISDLITQIEFLKDLAHTPINNKSIPDNTLEADAVISGHQESIEIQTFEKEQAAEAERILLERQALLDGNY